MATAKKTTTAVAVKPASNIVSIREQLAAQAAEMANRTAPPTGNAIRITQSKQFKLPDGSTTNGPLQLVIVDFVAANKFYEGAYDPNAITPPDCFAIDINPLKMVPSDNSPNRQAETCAACPNNVFGSAGAGKACKNTRVLAVLPPDGDANTPLWTLSVSPTAIKAFDGFVQSLSRLGTAPISMVTEVSFDPTKDYASLRFADPQPNENLAAHFARQPEAREMLLAEPDVSSYVAAAPAPARGRTAPARKTATARR